MDEIDAMLLGIDENEQRRARQRLLGFSHDPAVREYLDAEARLAVHRDRVKKQVGVVDRIMNEAERDVSHLVTTKWIHQAGKHDDRLVSSAMHMGPPLESVTAELRVQECMKMLLGGAPRFVDDVTFIAQMSTFAHPTETMDSSCVAMQKLITEAYGTAHELTACVNSQHATKLASMVANARSVYASMAQLTQSLHSNATAVRGELENLQGKMEVLQQHHQKALRVGREVIKENELLRRQLFKATVQQQGPDAAEDANSVMLSEKGLEHQKQLSDRVIVLLQVEGCHELRFKQPTLVSHGLLVLQSVVESVAAARAGTRINFNPLQETREHFNRGSNRRFPSESYAYSFADAGEAFLFATDVHDQLANAVRWPDELLELDQFSSVQSNDGSTHYIWRGLKVRAAIHCGIPFVTYPLADLDDAGKVDTDASSTRAMTSVIPFYGGLVMEKVMLLLQKTRPGETLATADSTKWFEKERFAKPELSHTISVVERILAGLQVGFALDEKIYGVVPRTLQLRVSDIPPFAYPDVVSAIFPTAAFWRQIDQSNEFTQQDFEDDQHRILAATSLLPHQYEEKIAALEFDLTKSVEQRKFLEENTTRLNADAIRLADELNKTVHQLKEANEAINKLRERTAKMPNLARRGEATTMHFADLVCRREDTIASLVAELNATKEKLAASEAQVVELTTFRGIDEDTNTDVPYPDVATAVADALAKRDKRDEAKARDAAMARNGAACTTCDSLVERLRASEMLFTRCSESYKLTLQAEMTAAELISDLNKAIAVYLDPEWTPDSTVVPSVTYERISDGSVADVMFSSPIEKGIVFAAAAATRVVTRFALTKALNQRMKGLSQATGDEIEYLMAENNKLETKISDLTVARRKETEEHRSELIKVQLENVKELNVSEAKVEDLSGQVKRLTARLGEMTERAQRFFEETCELVNQLETTRATNESNLKVKNSFENLVQTQYTPFVELTQGEKMLRDTNSVLRRQLQVLEAKVKARETELALKDRFIRDSNLGHAFELEMAKEAAASDERRLVDDELNAAISQIEQDERLKRAQADVELRKQRAEEESKAEYRRRQDAKKRDELRAARDEMEREEWKRTTLEALVEEEVQKRIEQMQFANRFNTPNSESPAATPIALPPLPTLKRKGGSGADQQGNGGSVGSRPSSGSKGPPTPKSHASSPTAAPTTVAVIPDHLTKSVLPLSSMPTGGSATPPRQSSARTFVCTSCSQRFVLRRTDSLPGAGASATDRPPSAAAMGSSALGVEGDSTEDWEGRMPPSQACVDQATQSSRRATPGPTAPPHAVADASSSTPATPLVRHSSGPTNGLDSVSPPALGATVGEGADGSTPNMVSTECQTIISVTPSDNIVPIVQSLEGLEMFNAALRAADQNAAAEDKPSASISKGGADAAGAVNGASQPQKSSSSRPGSPPTTSGAPNNRPVLLRAIAVGDGYIVLTADAASSMTDEIWLHDKATQSDATPASAAGATATTKPGSRTNSATNATTGANSAGSGKGAQSAAATAASGAPAGSSASTLVKGRSSEALRRSVKEGRATLGAANEAGGGGSDADSQSDAGDGPAHHAKKTRPILVHVGVQTIKEAVKKPQGSGGAASSGGEPASGETGSASADGVTAAAKQQASSKPSGSAITRPPAVAKNFGPQLNEATQTAPPRQSHVATFVNAQMLAVAPTHIGIQCELLTDRNMTALAPGERLSLADVMGTAAKRAAERHAAAHAGLKLATTTGATTIEANARAAIAGGRLQPLSGVAGARGAEVDEYIARTAEEHRAAVAAGGANGAGGGHTGNPDSPSLFAQHPRLAMQRRAEALIPATLGAAGVPPTAVAKLMVGAERDIRESTHAQFNAAQQRVNHSAEGRRPSPSRDVTRLLAGQDYEYVDTSALEPWRVGGRPNSGLSRPLSPRPLKNDDEEDPDELLQRFGLQTRDEVSVRSAHLKAAPAQAKYDVKKKAPLKSLVIGKPSSAAAAAGHPAKSATPDGTSSAKR